MLVPRVFVVVGASRNSGFDGNGDGSESRTFSSGGADPIQRAMQATHSSFARRIRDSLAAWKRVAAARATSEAADLLGSGLDPSTADTVLLRHIRTFNVTTLLFIALALPLCAITVTVGRPVMAALIATLVLASLANIRLLRRTLRPELSGYIGTALVFSFLIVDAATVGGFYHPSFSFLYIIPVVAGTLIGARGCLVWVAICSVTVLGFWLVADAGPIPSLATSPSVFALTSLVSRLAAVVALGILAVAFTTAQRRLEVALQQRGAEQQKDADLVRLLHEAASASNESTSLDDAFRSSIELICRRLGWPIGLVYSTSLEEPGVLRASPIRFVADDERYAAFVARHRAPVRGRADELASSPMRNGAPEWIEDVGQESGTSRADGARAAGIGAVVLLPVPLDNGVTAVLEFFAAEPLPRDARLIGYLEQVAGQIGHAAERALARDRMRSLVLFDSLTGLPNRRFFHERLGIAMKAADRDQGKLALFFIDLDGFKAVNDTLGHEIGDGLLAAVATRLSRILRSSDFVARTDDGGAGREQGSAVSRLGGDEFTLLLPGSPSRAAVEKIGERLITAFRDPFRVGDRDIFTGASIGVAFYPEDGADMTSLLRSADVAMYHAKEPGHSKFQFFEFALRESGSRRLTLERRLPQAIENEEFELHYQPIRDTESGHVVAVEALLRWNDSELGSVTPAEFIPAAESCGQIVSLGAWVLRTAIAQAGAWVDAGMRPIRISVNISGQQVRHPAITTMIRDAIRRHQLDASWLELELTESTIIKDDEVTNEILREISDLGVGLALDDFGTGYSSLSYLRRLPISRLKIDRSFVSDIPVSQADCSLVRAIIAMAHRLRISVVAEGVETEAQLEFLRRYGCDEVQGFLFSPAVPADELTRVLEPDKDEE